MRPPSAKGAARRAAGSAWAERPVDLALRCVSKRFGGVTAVSDCLLDVHRGEILALLGPSGCGKTTLLNIVAGFEDPDAGTVELRGRALNEVPPNRRETGMVFQHYALFPHMTVRGNIAYGLSARRRPRHEINDQVDDAIALLKLDGLGERYPSELSGGQKQRVAVARALAVRPQVLLLDEAFSALDKNLREEMQIELSLLLRRLGITTILVTHDQREAFAVADRIAVMEHGRIVQVGTPSEVYLAPRSSFVLEFLGSVNLLAGMIRGRADGQVAQTASGISFRPQPPVEAPDGAAVRIYVRAEDVALSRSPTAVHAAGPGTVLLVTFLGPVRRVVIDLGGQQVLAERPAGETGDFGAGERVFVDFRPGSAHVLRDS
ncbi:MAG: ABC transporter ATP-binding protein [Proteobacteria bacterium]|nr:ABC transporter ATP-binding protein [Pseudomonadota bacterium]